jgi:Ser/Thr protein kinase RdoA (MazF antagonist)
MNTEFDNCTYLSQVRRLRLLAYDVLKFYKLPKFELKFVYHGENTTFKVVTKQNSYLLRIHCRSHRTDKAMLEELRWLKKLSSTQGVRAQKPILAKNGQALINVYSEAVGHHRLCDLLEWREGQMRNKKSPKTFLEVGKLIGLLQKNTIKTRHRDYWHAEGLLGNNATLGPLRDLYSEFPCYAKRIEVLRRELLKKLKSYEKRNQDKMGLIHADLHFGNMIWSKGGVCPIDFDDCGFGLNMYDLAVTLAQSSFYFKKVSKKEGQMAKQSLLVGYQEHRALSSQDLAIIPFLVATRELSMLGWLYDRRDNPELYAYLKKNLGKRVKKAEKYLVQAREGSYFN